MPLAVMRIVNKIRRANRLGGWREILKGAGRFLYFYLVTIPSNFIFHYMYLTLRRLRIKTFSFCGRTYEYFYHRYNFTWNNERIVEIPIIWEAVRLAEGKRILEIGNVLNHYFPHRHDVVDKYEKWQGVIHEDVINFVPRGTYDLIVSISTLEHVGWDTGEEKDPSKIFAAITHLTELLAPQGKIVFTIPVGYNPFLDQYINEGRITLSERSFLKQISKHVWKEVGYEEAHGACYDYPFPAANAVLVGVIRKEK